MNPPTESEIIDALDDYRNHILEHNTKVFMLLVHVAETAEAPEDFDDEEIAEMRREFMWDQLCVSRPESLPTDDPRLITVPSDVLRWWDDIVAIPELALDGTVVIEAECQRAAWREEYRAGIEAGLRAMGGQAAKLWFPDDFAVIMEHVDSLEGPGWPLYREHYQQVCFWNGLGETADAVAERVWTDPEALKRKVGRRSWDVLAGWECGRGADATCFIVYFRDQEDQRIGYWWWRYVVHLGPDVYIFDSVVQLLGWYKTFREPALEFVDFIAGRVFE
ncbi:hypothetical protein F4810DRAFT_708348 [Camillea tinctor]|nr:hypothetical protein F4810DRAFT_708348 [Camillea tinctor]